MGAPQPHLIALACPPGNGHICPSGAGTMPRHCRDTWHQPGDRQGPSWGRLACRAALSGVLSSPTAPQCQAPAAPGHGPPPHTTAGPQSPCFTAKATCSRWPRPAKTPRVPRGLQSGTGGASPQAQEQMPAGILKAFNKVTSTHLDQAPAASHTDIPVLPWLAPVRHRPPGGSGSSSSDQVPTARPPTPAGSFPSPPARLHLGPLHRHPARLRNIIFIWDSNKKNTTCSPSTAAWGTLWDRRTSLQPPMNTGPPTHRREPLVTPPLTALLGRIHHDNP